MKFKCLIMLLHRFSDTKRYSRFHKNKDTQTLWAMQRRCERSWDPVDDSRKLRQYWTEIHDWRAVLYDAWHDSRRPNQPSLERLNYLFWDSALPYTLRLCEREMVVFH